MNTPASTRFYLASVLLTASAIFSVSTKAIAQETEPVVLPAQITNQFQGFRFTNNPYANAQTLSIADKDRSGTGFRTVQDEANADAPRSESSSSGFKIRIGLDDRDDSDSAEE